MIFKNVFLIIRYKRATLKPFIKKSRIYKNICHGGNLVYAQILKHRDRFSCICIDAKICLRVLRRRSRFIFFELPIFTF